MSTFAKLVTLDGLENRNNKERRRWKNGGGNGHNRRKRDNRPCAKGTCKQHALEGSIHCAKHTDTLQVKIRKVSA